MPFWPTSPPAITPVRLPPSTLLLLTLTLADGAGILAGKHADELARPARVRVRLDPKIGEVEIRIVPVAPMAPNRPILLHACRRSVRSRHC